MENKQPLAARQQWTRENTLDLVRTLRNQLVKDFLDERVLIEYLAGTYNKKELSNTRMAFVRKELKELLIAPVDVHHYSSLINDIEENNRTAISYKNETLFFKEIDRILSKYIF